MRAMSPLLSATARSIAFEARAYWPLLSSSGSSRSTRYAVAEIVVGSFC
ncbi:hypothetical protein J7F03_34225 [Streptomyces sp. ISL-43]|nr:hypothetical protein [Streptomyces sp. ISL-43]MBT2452029.1 hypothetical protein [Streptomyces sp. ISL-43]